MRKDMNMSARDRLIVALDVDTQKEAEALVEKLSEFVGVFKVGPRLFTRCGPKIIDFVKEKNSRVFYDAKFYDIPSVVKKAAQASAEMGVDLLTLHTLGGSEMMEAAVEGIRSENSQVDVLGVTLLTSLSSRILKEELGIERNLTEEIIHLAGLARKAGLDGVITSAWELEELRRNFGSDFILVVPGIRPLRSAKFEQRRVSTPKEAIEKGADFLVVGRPILNSHDPVEITKRILTEMNH
ncbi:MAG: orotidine-5'-phosphate decarboxylase [Thermodesulfobacteriota bacterium]